jgi:uncharacterized YccA/Bax inhibitor family protein
VLTAVLLTCGILFALLGAYDRHHQGHGEFQARHLRRHGRHRDLLPRHLGARHVWHPDSGLFGNGWVGIAFSGFVVVIAALNLVLDFDFIENGCAAGAPKHMEWYAAFGLLVTLVWLYLEILRLLAKLRSRD